MLAGSIAAIFASLRQPDQAFRWLDIAVAARDSEAGYLKVDPRIAALHDRPRIQAILSHLGQGV